MNQRLTAPLGILLMLSAGLGCSFLRPKRPLTWHLTLQVDAPTAERAASTEQVMTLIERRLEGSGVFSYDIKTDGDPSNGRILVNLPSTPDRDRLANLITAQGKLELTALSGPSSPAPVQTFPTQNEAIAFLNNGRSIPPGLRVLPYDERTETSNIQNTERPEKWVIVGSPAIVDGRELRNAVAVRTGTDSEEYQIDFTLKPDGAEQFGRWTAANINRYLGIVLNDRVKSIAFIKSQITDSGQIQGRFNKQSAEDLAVVLRTGTLPAAVRIVDESVKKP